MVTLDSARILIADDEETFRLSTAELLRRHGYACECAQNSEEAAARLTDSYDLLIADIRMPGNMELEFLRSIQRRLPILPIIVITGYPSVQTAVDSLRLTVLDYMIKPVELPDLLSSVAHAVRRARLLRTQLRDSQAVHEWGETLEQLAQSLYSSGGQATESKFAWTLDRYLEQNVAHIGMMAGMLKWTLGAVKKGTSDEPMDVCALMHCPRAAAYEEALSETIRVIEQTKEAFKSKQLGELRNRLEALLKQARHSRFG